MHINPLIPNDEILARFPFDPVFLTYKDENVNKLPDENQKLHLVFPIEEDLSKMNEVHAISILNKIARLVEAMLDQVEDQKPYQYEFGYYLDLLRTAVDFDLAVFGANTKSISNVLRHGINFESYRTVSRLAKLHIIKIYEKLIRR